MKSKYVKSILSKAITKGIEKGFNITEEKIKQLFELVKRDWMDTFEVYLICGNNDYMLYVLDVGDEDWLIIYQKGNIVKSYMIEMWSLILETIEKYEPDKIMEIG